MGPRRVGLREQMPRVVPGYKEQARGRIVDAAAAVFRRKGLVGGTMEEIAREIGVSKGALYLYFPTKSRLLEAVQARLRSQYLELLERCLREGDVADGFADSLERILPGDFDPSVWHQLIVEATADPEVRAVLRRDAQEDRKNVGAILRRLAHEGRIPPMRDPEATVGAVLLLMQGTYGAIALRAEPGEIRNQLVPALRLVLGTPTRRAAGRRSRKRSAVAVPGVR